MIPRAQWYCPQVNMTWLHHWGVNIGLNNDLVSSGNKPFPWPMFRKICMSLSRSQRVNIFTDSRWTDWFLSRSLHGIQLNFQKTKIFGSTSIIHLSDVTVFGSLSYQRWSGAGCRCPAMSPHKIRWLFPDISLTIFVVFPDHETYNQHFITVSTLILQAIWQITHQK